MIADFNQRLKNGEMLLGTMVTLSAPEISEILSQMGFDWLFVDGEHGAFDIGDLKSLLQTVGDRTAVLVRVPAIDEVPIKSALDLGANGIIVPQVSTADQARQVVQFSRYPPQGGRGVGLGRAHGYGSRFHEYMESANQTVSVVIQAEHIDAVNNMEQIVQVPGFDSILVGPYDLSASIGKMGEVDHPEVIEAIDHVAQVCLAANVPLGIFGTHTEAVRPYMDRGFKLIVAGTDTGFLASSARRLLEQLQSSRDSN